MPAACVSRRKPVVAGHHAVEHDQVDAIGFAEGALARSVRSDRGASRQLLVAALERRYPVLASVPLMLQYESVLTRPEHVEAAGISAVDVEILLDALAVVVEPIRISYLWRPVLPDTGDDPTAPRA